MPRNDDQRAGFPNEMRFLEFGDLPRLADPLQAWPRYSRVGREPLVGTGKGSANAGNMSVEASWALVLQEQQKRKLIKLDDDEAIMIVTTIMMSGVLDDGRLKTMFE